MHKKLIYGFLLTCFVCVSLTAQSVIDQSVINRYTRVTGIRGNVVTVDDVSFITDTEINRDTVLLIQMTGIDRDGNEPAGTGRYEFHIVQSVDRVEKTITLTTKAGVFDIGSTFDPVNEMVQLVRVPSYRGAQVDALLTCKEWNWSEGTGGVLALMVEGTLTLNADIDVSGQGFKGGRESGAYNGECSILPAYQEEDYPESAANRAGFKGEGALKKALFESYPRGYGITYNGGGGGNGKYAGGGGGANGGIGGNGNIQVCNVPRSPNPNGGNALKYRETLWQQRAFMGGGGGSGTGTNTIGGAGGGIVLIAADTLVFNNGAQIKSNGASVIGTARYGGAGGGGAGGSILLSVSDYGDFDAEIKGGNGGNAYKEDCNNLENDSRGVGGGGGGGLLYVSMSADDITGEFESWVAIDKGAEGELEGSTCFTQALPGETGIIQGDMELQIRGFFYNFIITKSAKICYDASLTLEASYPQGGNGVYTYEWQVNRGNGWETIENSNTQNYTIPSLRMDSRFRRVVKSQEFDGNNWVPVEDLSVPVPITIVPEILNELSFPDTTVCGSVTSLLLDVDAATGGEGGFTYQWEESINDPETWDAITQATEIQYMASLSPGIQYYRRKATSAGCTVASKAVKINILPVISGNIIGSDRELCEGTSAPQLGTHELTGGDESYRYVWQWRNDIRDWETIEESGKEYQPDAVYIGDRYYRRIVSSGIITSGSYDCCFDTSSYVVIHYDQQPIPNPVSAGADQTMHFKFTTSLDASAVEVGTGQWTVVAGHMDFAHPDQPFTDVSNLEMGTNIAQWTVSNGVCPVVSDQVTIEVRDVFIPSGFSPNGDGINECFKALGAQNALSSELIIFNRYNNIVYESKSFKGKEDDSDCTGWWDGRNSSGNELPSGMYFYQLTLNGDKVYKGYVVLKK